MGLVGAGERGSWIAKLFQEHGGYDLHAVADYFPEVAEEVGAALNIPSSRRFSTLSGFKRLLDSGVDAVALELPVYFFPEYASMAVEAGVHVYMAKPVAADVPGCLRILEAGQRASRREKCFWVDYQIPTDPSNQQVCDRVKKGAIGPIAHLQSIGTCPGLPDPAPENGIESRLRHLIWVNDVALGADYIGNYDIHAIDAALWLAGERPIAASGASSIRRPDPHGDSRDVCSVVYEYASGIVHNHYGQALNNQSATDLLCRVYGRDGTATLTYWGKAQVRSKADAWVGPVENLYEAGARRNIAAFHQAVIARDFSNTTVPRSVDGALACILGREAAARRTRLTMDELLREKRSLEVDLSSLRS
ncbi:Gfo/Idh/MocA family protein [Nibricoccus sp. IMCC34717]|uniref:Gfo/Idh/MocA family protein n=1 Tax=Nibricoccus sp. IMCC34717 TaxID=3034021 RepID=UPI00385163D7